MAKCKVTFGRHPFHPVNPELAELLAQTTREVAHITSRRREWRDMAQTHFHASGRRWRAQLALQAGLDLALDHAAIVSIAVACELVHNASLVQDDWMDRDPERRGHPAVWARFGPAAAILFSDFLLMAGLSALNQLNVSERNKSLATAILARRIQQASAGQCLELQSASDPLPPSQYLKITAAKTGTLLSLPVELVLAAAGQWRRHGRTARRGLAWIGQGYQLVDDLIDGSPTHGCDAGDAVMLCDQAGQIFQKLPSPLAQTLRRAARDVRDTAWEASTKAAA